MNRFVRSLLLCFALTVGATAWAQQPPAPPEQPAPAAEPAQPAAPAAPATDEPVERDSEIHIDLRDRSDNVVLNMWGDARLPANEIADGVISIFGDTYVEGEVWDAVVAIFGNAHVTGQVRGGVVSIFGNTYIDGPVGDAAVAVFGDLELGPNARVEGDIAVVAGKLTRHPSAVVSGQSEIVAGGFPALEGVRVWIEKCLLYARPLAFEPGLGWAWGIAFGFLLFYVVIALMFDKGVTRCVETLETQPGQSVVASLLAIVAVPVAFVLLLISVVGIVIVP
ncbi:MAG TPA: polymer-forming cytoskeletal protein, partial [Steroidobacteraceae bacterium]|nr:polymer-forming cytoskeletal protein [Steroidobacteraceae bacterium]